MKHLFLGVSALVVSFVVGCGGEGSVNSQGNEEASPFGIPDSAQAVSQGSQASNWAFKSVTAYYHPYGGEKDMGSHNSACTHKLGLNGKSPNELLYFAINEGGDMWNQIAKGSWCNNDRWETCNEWNDCWRLKDQIPSEFKRYKNGKLEVRVPNCDGPADKVCGKKVQIRREGDSGEGIEAYIGDICPNKHWNNNTGKTSCQAEGSFVDMYIELCKKLSGGKCDNNLKVDMRLK